MSDIVGFNIHRGCLGLGVRPPPTSIAELIGGPLPATTVGQAFGSPASAVSRVIVLEAVSNVDNIGGIFRSVAALGGHAVVVGPGCGDPLYRKAIRTSMGATLRVPFASATAWPEALHDLQAAGFTLVGLTPEPACGAARGRGRRPAGASARRAARGSRRRRAQRRGARLRRPPRAHSDGAGHRLHQRRHRRRHRAVPDRVARARSGAPSLV